MSRKSALISISHSRNQPLHGREEFFDLSYPAENSLCMEGLGA